MVPGLVAGNVDLVPNRYTTKLRYYLYLRRGLCLEISEIIDKYIDT